MNAHRMDRPSRIAFRAEDTDPDLIAALARDNTREGMTMDLREKIAEAAKAFLLDIGKSPGHDLGAKGFMVEDDVFCVGLRISPDELADAILAIPELAEALRLKPIKTMPVRD